MGSGRNMKYCISASLCFIKVKFHYTHAPILYTIELEHLHTIGRLNGFADEISQHSFFIMIGAAVR